MAQGETKQFSTIPYVPGQLKVPSQYSTIQAGLNAARKSDTVLVAVGTYTENIIWPDVNSIRLFSEGDSSNTIIKHSDISLPILLINSSASTIDTTTHISGFTFLGNNGDGIGIRLEGDSPLLSKIHVTNNGEGLYATGSNFELLNSKISNNKKHGGNIIGSRFNRSTIKNTIFIGNGNLSSTGGGLRAQTAFGGNNDGPIIDISNSKFLSNSAHSGGGIGIIYRIQVIMNDVIISNNKASQYGGGIYSDRARFDDLDGVPIYLDDFQGDGINTSYIPAWNNVEISFNEAESGGGIYLYHARFFTHNVLVNNLLITGNKGGGIFSEESYLFIDSSVVSNNDGIGIFANEYFQLRITNTTVVHNSEGGIGISETIPNYHLLKNPYIFQSTITNNDKYGISVIPSNRTYLLKNFKVENSNILGNKFGLRNVEGITAKAVNNYWGDLSGPYHPTQNASGKGDSVNAFVNLDPWLTAPNTDAPPIPAQNLKLDSQTVTSATFSWDASKIGDLAGYKFYYDTDSSGYPYTNSVDLGNVVTKSLTGLTAGKTYYVAVSTYDTDGNESWYSKEVSVTMNNTPVIAAVSDVTINEDESSTVTLSATDVEGDAITYSAVSDTNAVTVSVSSSTLTLTPNANWHGVANIKVYASDGYSKDSTSFKLTVTPVDDISAVQDMTIDEDKSAEVTLTSTFSGTTTFTAVSDTNAVTTSVSSSALTLTPTANWHGVANIKAYASDGTSKDSTSFTLTVTSVNDAPTAFEWVSSALDTINITQSNLADTYTLQWGASTDPIEGDSISYLLYAKIGVNPPEKIYDTTSTSVSITYEEFLENVFEPFPMLPRVTVKFTIVATDGIDTVNVTGDDRVVSVNRYEYLSTADEGIPTEFALHENYPNPFNPTTTLRFDLPEVSDITLTIYNMLGQRVRTFNMQSTPAGYHTITWDATNDFGEQVGAGVYLYQLQAKDFVKTRKMVLLK